MEASPVFKTTIVLWLTFLGFCGVAAAGYDYRPGLKINAPLFTDHFIELR